jgi:hypothetical protein
MVTGTPWKREKIILPGYQKQIKYYIVLHYSGIKNIGFTLLYM